MDVDPRLPRMAYYVAYITWAGLSSVPRPTRQSLDSSSGAMPEMVASIELAPLAQYQMKMKHVGWSFPKLLHVSLVHGRSVVINTQ
jgi:hypothetical protein